MQLSDEELKQLRALKEEDAEAGRAYSEAGERRRNASEALRKYVQALESQFQDTMFPEHAEFRRQMDERVANE
jgi:hypothetical protein